MGGNVRPPGVSWEAAMLALTLWAALAASDAPTLDAERPLTSLTRSELKAEYARLEAARPSVAGPVTLMAVGGGMIAYSSIFMLSAGQGGVDALFRSGSGLAYVFVALMMGGAAMLVPGAWLAWSRRTERAALGERMDAINERLDQLDRAEEHARDRQPAHRAPARQPRGYVPQL